MGITSDDEEVETDGLGRNFVPNPDRPIRVDALVDGYTSEVADEIRAVARATGLEPSMLKRDGDGFHVILERPGENRGEPLPPEETTG